jgi:transcription elongation factor Elf1
MDSRGPTADETRRTVHSSDEEEETIRVCPECDDAHISHRTLSAPSQLEPDADRFKCHVCGATFNDPTEREPHNRGLNPAEVLERAGFDAAAEEARKHAGQTTLTDGGAVSYGDIGFTSDELPDPDAEEFVADEQCPGCGHALLVVPPESVANPDPSRWMTTCDHCSSFDAFDFRAKRPQEIDRNDAEAGGGQP